MAALGLALAAAAPAHAYELQRTQGGTPLRWPEMPVRFAVGDARSDTAGNYVFAVRKAFAEWETPEWTALRTEYIGRRATGLDDDSQTEPEAVLVRWLVPWPEELGSSDMIVGITRLDYDAESGTIFGARVAFNGERFAWAADGTENRVDVLAATLHEGGHALGMDHSAVAIAVMYPRGAFSVDDRALAPDDWNGMSDLYLSSSRQIAPQPQSATKAICSGIVTVNDFSTSRIARVVLEDADGASIVSRTIVSEGAVMRHASFDPPIDGIYDVRVVAENGKQGFLEDVELLGHCELEEDMGCGGEPVCVGCCCGSGGNSALAFLTLAALFPRRRRS